MKAVLFIDDDAPLIETARKTFEAHGLKVYGASTPQEAALLVAQHPEISLAFVELDVFDGLEPRRALSAAPKLSLVIHTRCSSDRVAGTGAELFLRKPTSIGMLLACTEALSDDSAESML